MVRGAAAWTYRILLPDRAFNILPVVLDVPRVVLRLKPLKLHLEGRGLHTPFRHSAPCLAFLWTRADHVTRSGECSRPSLVTFGKKYHWHLLSNSREGHHGALLQMRRVSALAKPCLSRREKRRPPANVSGRKSDRSFRRTGISGAAF